MLSLSFVWLLNWLILLFVTSSAHVIWEFNAYIDISTLIVVQGFKGELNVVVNLKVNIVVFEVVATIATVALVIVVVVKLVHVPPVLHVVEEFLGMVVECVLSIAIDILEELSILESLLTSVVLGGVVEGVLVSGSRHVVILTVVSSVVLAVVTLHEASLVEVAIVSILQVESILMSFEVVGLVKGVV
jgi:hypothetical protein